MDGWIDTLCPEPFVMCVPFELKKKKKNSLLNPCQLCFSTVTFCFHLGTERVTA